MEIILPFQMDQYLLVNPHMNKRIFQFYSRILCIFSCFHFMMGLFFLSLLINSCYDEINLLIFTGYMVSDLLAVIANLLFECEGFIPTVRRVIVFSTYSFHMFIMLGTTVLLGTFNPCNNNYIMTWTVVSPCIMAMCLICLKLMILADVLHPGR
jgi:hypothetical protein